MAIKDDMYELRVLLHENNAIICCVICITACINIQVLVKISFAWLISFGFNAYITVARYPLLCCNTMKTAMSENLYGRFAESC